MPHAQHMEDISLQVVINIRKFESDTQHGRKTSNNNRLERKNKDLNRIYSDNRDINLKKNYLKQKTIPRNTNSLSILWVLRKKPVK